MRSIARTLCLVSVAAVVALLASVSSANAATVEEFQPTTIHYPGASFSSTVDINGDGLIVGIYRCVVTAGCTLTGPAATAGNHGFLLQDGVYTRIDVPGGTGTVIRGISEQGTIIGHYVDSNRIRGFFYSQGTYTYPFDIPAEHFDNPASTAPLHTLPVRVSPQGDIVGCIHEGNDTMNTMHGWLLRNGTITLIPAPDTMNNGISGNGVVVGFYFADGVSYLADENGIVTEFTFDGDRFTLAWDINARGDAVGVVGTNQKMTVGNPQNPSGFLRTNAGHYVELKVTGASSTQVIGINNARDVVGQYTAGGVTRGFVHRLKIEKPQD